MWLLRGRFSHTFSAKSEETPQNSVLRLSEGNKAGLIQTVPAFPGPVLFWAQGVTIYLLRDAMCVFVCACVSEVSWVTRASVHNVDTETLAYILMFIFMSLYFSLSYTQFI